MVRALHRQYNAGFMRLKQNAMRSVIAEKERFEGEASKMQVSPSFAIDPCSHPYPKPNPKPKPKLANSPSC